MSGIILKIFGGVLLSIGIFGYVVPLDGGIGTLDDISQKCNSSFGQLSALINTMQINCPSIQTISKVIHIFLGLGSLLLILGTLKR